jgi:enterochelin esterase family protein
MSLMRTKFLFGIIFLLGFSTCQNNGKQNIDNDSHFKEIIRPYMTISPKIADILLLTGTDLNTAIEKEWEKSTQQGLPLIETDTLDSDYVFMTFMYKDSSKNKEISFEVFGIYDETRLGDMKLYHIQNTSFYYRCYKVPSDICFSYRFIVKDTISGQEIKAIDNFNQNRIPYGEIRDISYSVLDLRTNEKDWNVKNSNDFEGKIDTIKYTDKIVNRERNIYVYLPPNYNEKRKEAYPTIYLFDASIYLNRVELPNILDNLINEKKIEPMIAVLFGTYRSTRDVILPLNFEFKNEFINDVLPLVRSSYNTSLNPEKNIIGGMSYGGLAAAFIAFDNPNIFGKVLSQSGSFWRGLELTDSEGEWIREDWLVNKFLTEKRKPLKIYLDWGLQENWVLGSNRRFVQVLSRKGYEYRFEEFNGWHDWSNSRKTFPAGLMYLAD